MIDIESAKCHWHPIAASDDLHYRHVFHAQLLGRELAVWRADDDTVNAWENRCLHRGVRLSIGINDGTELVCQYHGWRYANRTASCTYIPAHPADAPARTICNNTYAVCERFGLVWSCEIPEVPLPNRSNLSLSTSDATIPTHAVTVNASIEDTAEGLLMYFAHHPLPGTPENVIPITKQPSPFTLLFSTDSKSPPCLLYFLQPVDSARTTIRGLLCGIELDPTNKSKLTQLLRQHANVLNRCQEHIESVAANKTTPPPWIPLIPRLSESNAKLPALSAGGRQAALRVRVARIDEIGRSAKSFVFEALDASLPTAQPGAHIDIHLPNGLIRQYSLLNGPGQTDHYAIAVKLLSDSTGGSQTLHNSIKVGDVLATSVPRNNFTLRRDATHTILIAGGIGITPLLSMARALHHSQLPFSLHYFTTDERDILFSKELSSMGGDVQWHTGLSIDQTRQSLQTLLNNPAEHQHIYLCGPGPMLAMSREIASNSGWSDNTIHFEYFKNTATRNDSASFTVDLARSGLTLNVPSGETLLSVLRDNHIAVPSSCEQGACGTCKITVLNGEPDHQDVYLSDTEKARADCMISCVSRAKSKRLTLDL